MKRLLDVLDDRSENYILPFFWQHGESEDKLREYMAAIHGCGIEAVCVECRPHPDFGGPKWWLDMDVILDEARKRSMKVWILDDAHFPTGYANGALKNAPAALHKQFLFFSVQEIAGPMPDVTFRLGLEQEDTLLSVFAYPAEGDGIDASHAVELTDAVCQNRLTWNVPEGYWRIISVFRTTRDGGNRDYINLLDQRSVRVLLDAVYETHYNHYQADFGKTIAGFFSDESQLGNAAEYYPDWRIGKQMPLPWSDELEELLWNAWGNAFGTNLASLWFNSDLSGSVRLTYMDEMTKLVEKNFSCQIGAWCESHGVQYIGHVIEDNGEHARMGQSTGHFFRSMTGQHMAGIDCIGGQVLPGGENVIRSFAHQKPYEAPCDDGVFYHYTLGEMAASLAALDPKKHGNSMCELFGAYGWHEGTRLMKYLADHFLVRGVNHYVPHAFSPKPFPDNDHPPHFYAHGLNPMYPGFGDLMRYMNRVCHLISGGNHVSPVALLYHAENEWRNEEGAYMKTRVPAKVLAEHQINYDIVWLDALKHAEIGHTLKTNDQEYMALVIPYCKHFPESLKQIVFRARQVNFPVYMAVENMETADHSVPIALVGDLPKVLAITREIRLSSDFPLLRYYHYLHADGEIFLFANQDTVHTFSGSIQLRADSVPYLYDPLRNRLYPADYRDGILSITIEPYEMFALCFIRQDANVSSHETEQLLPGNARLALTGPWLVSFKDALNQAAGFHDEITLPALRSLSQDRPDFSGWISYETTFSCRKNLPALLELTEVYDCAEVFLNGQSVGRRICPPYRFNVSQTVREGENRLRIEVATTLERAAAKINRTSSDPNAGFVFDKREKGILHPFGLMGKVQLCGVDVF